MKKIEVNILYDNNEYTFDCNKEDNLETVKNKLLEEKPELNGKIIKFLLDDKILDLGKSLKENQIKKNKTIVINVQNEENNDKIIDQNKTFDNSNNKEKIQDNNKKEKENNQKNNKEENKDKEKNKINKDNKENNKDNKEKNNENKEKNKDKDNKEENKGNINNDEISVIMKDENQNTYNCKCKITDEFQSLEIDLFNKNPSLKEQKINYFINNNNIDISSTIKQNNIKNGSIISFKIDKNETEDNGEISVIIKSTGQDFKSSFICRKTDNFKVLEQKLYKRNPKLKNKSLCYLYYGNAIDVNKTIEENKIKDSSIIMYNELEAFDEEI